MFKTLLKLLPLSSALVLTAGGDIGSERSMLEASSLARECGQCEEELGEDDIYHRFSGSGVFFDCEPNSCHTNWQPDRCAGWHNDCTGELVYQEVKRAITDFEIGRGAADLRTLVTGNESVVLNPERRALQVTGCDGRIIAHIPLSDRHLTALSQ